MENNQNLHNINKNTVNLRNGIDKIWDSKFEETDIFQQVNSVIQSKNLKDLDTKDFSSKKEFCKYIFSEELGISFYFNDLEMVDTCKEIYIYNIDKKFKRFPCFDTLPYNIAFDWTNKDFVSGFGEPDNKTGGKGLTICLSYDKLGFEVNFDAHNWETTDANITYLVFFQRKKIDKENQKCCVCGKNNKKISSCGQCKVADYCSQECQKHHWTEHKKICPKLVIRLNE